MSPRGGFITIGHNLVVGSQRDGVAGDEHEVVDVPPASLLDAGDERMVVPGYTAAMLPVAICLGDGAGAVLTGLEGHDSPHGIRNPRCGAGETIG